MDRVNSTLPTIELGDAERPTILFIHGYPDNAAIWAHQFEHFCLHGDYRCVAPTWYNAHPDLPPMTRDKLSVMHLTDALEDLVVEELNVAEVVLVMHDFGVKIGCSWMGKTSIRVSHAVYFDLAPSWNVQSSQYARTLAAAFERRSFALLLLGMAQSTILEPVTLVRRISEIRVAMRSAWIYGGGGEVPHRVDACLNHDSTLFVYGECARTREAPQCQRRGITFWDDAYVDHLLSAPGGSLALGIPFTGHWIPNENPRLANAVMTKWLALQKSCSPAPMF